MITPSHPHMFFTQPDADYVHTSSTDSLASRLSRTFLSTVFPALTLLSWPAAENRRTEVPSLTKTYRQCHGLCLQKLIEEKGLATEKLPERNQGTRRRNEQHL